MRIVADSNIPYVEEAFSGLGTVRCVSGREIAPETLADAGILLIRSVTRVNKALLGGSPVRFVATATIGVDHVDTAFLRDASIGFASAPGSNANSVAEYVAAAILETSHRLSRDPRGMVLGIVGVGNVGSRVLRVGQALGMRCLPNDPPKQRATGASCFVPLEAVLAESDIVTVHVPLSDAGPDATRGLVNGAFLERMKKGAVLMNTSRGDVVVEEDLRARRDRLGGLVLDVWAGEPSVDPRTLEIADIATSHIAGYSYDGKVRGTQMIYDAACAYHFRERVWDASVHLSKERARKVNITRSSHPLYDAVLGAYAIGDDDRGMRELARLDAPRRAAHFDELRRKYPKRLEFAHVPLVCEGVDEETTSALKALGFTMGEARGPAN